MGVQSSGQPLPGAASAMQAAMQAQVHGTPGHMPPGLTPGPHQTLHQPGVTMELPFQDTELRSSSIAALRLKAREHSAAMGILSVYGK